jgi:hypothetical protein
MAVRQEVQVDALDWGFFGEASADTTLNTAPLALDPRGDRDPLVDRQDELLAVAADDMVAASNELARGRLVEACDQPSWD